MIKIHNLLIIAVLTAVLSGCWIGDQDDPEILYDETIIELLCQTPELSTFCDMIYLTPVNNQGNSAGLVPIAAWTLQFSGPGRSGGVACPSGVETVFAFTNDAWDAFALNFPHWSSIYDIPQDTVHLIIKHHIFLNGKLIGPNSQPECSSVPIIFGSIGMRMWLGKWIFVTNGQGDFIAVSDLSGLQTLTAIESPDLSTTDGAVYIVHDVLAPFLW